MLVFSDGVYRFEGREKTSTEMPAFWAELCDRYPIVSIAVSYTHLTLPTN